MDYYFQDEKPDGCSKVSTEWLLKYDDLLLRTANFEGLVCPQDIRKFSFCLWLRIYISSVFFVCLLW